MHILLQLEYLILNTSNLILNHLVLGDKVTVHVLFIDTLLARGGVLDEQLLQVLELNLKSVVVVRDDHVVLLSDLAHTTQLLVFSLQSCELELILLNDLLQRHLDLHATLLRHMWLI